MNSSLAPQQDRSVRTQQSLIDALERLLETHSFDDITVAQIAAEAELTTGAIYRRFRDKRALMQAAFERFVERSIALQPGRLAQTEKKNDVERIEQMITSTLEFATPYLPLMRAASALNDELSFEHMRRARNLTSDWWAALFTSSSLDKEDLVRRTRFAMRTITAVFRDTHLAGPGTSKRHQKQAIENMVRELTEMTKGYLQINK